MSSADSVAYLVTTGISTDNGRRGLHSEEFKVGDPISKRFEGT
jgi:hypothetical protein